MNLTLKQLFKFGAVCTCACALVATAATDYVSDSFEVSDGGSDGMAIAEYKQVVETGGLGTVTSYVWYAESGDASAIVANDAAYANYTGESPITNATKALVLNLETEGNTLSRTAGVSFATAPVYVDTLVKFTPSEDDPTIDTEGIKVALWVNAESNLVVTHSAYEYELYTPSTTNSVLEDVEIDPAQWYRLTMQLVKDAAEGLHATKIWLNGSELTHANAITVSAPWTWIGGGSLFGNIDASATKADFNKISFQGTGMLDELVVTDTMPDFGGSLAMEITLYAEGGVTFDPVGPVGSGDTVTITAIDDWKWLASLTGPVDEAGVVNAKSITTTLTASSSCTVTANIEYAGSDFAIGGKNYPIAGAKGIGTWADGQGLTEAQVGAAQEDDYLLNVADGTNAEIKIDSIVISGTTVTIVVGNTDNANVDFTDINGTLKLYSQTTLGGSWTLVGEATVTANDTAEFDLTGVSNATDFFKAVVE